MRYVVGFVLALGLVASPRSVSAQYAGEEGSSPVERRHPEAFQEEGTSQEPALRLEQEREGVHIYPDAVNAAKDPALSEMELRIGRARGGLVGTALIAGVGGVLMIGGIFGSIACMDDIFAPPEPCPAEGVFIAGTVVTAAGVVGMLIAGTAAGRA